MTETIYAIGRDDGPYKVGRTKNVARRLTALRCSSPEQLYVHLTAQSADGALDEQEIHVALATHRLAGEWFECGLSLIRDAMVSAGLEPQVPRAERAARDDEIDYSFPPMTPEDFCAWVDEMRVWRFGRTETQLAALLGVDMDEFSRMKREGASHTIGLACRALRHNFTPFSQSGPFMMANYLGMTVAV